MIKRHRDQRTSFKAERDGKKSHYKDKMNLEKNACKPEVQATIHSHGVKRSGSTSWEIDNHKVVKHKHPPNNSNEYMVSMNNNFGPPKNLNNQNVAQNGLNSTMHTNEKTFKPGVNYFQKT